MFLQQGAPGSLRHLLLNYYLFLALPFEFDFLFKIEERTFYFGWKFFIFVKWVWNNFLLVLKDNDLRFLFPSFSSVFVIFYFPSFDLDINLAIEKNKVSKFHYDD